MDAEPVGRAKGRCMAAHSVTFSLPYAHRLHWSHLIRHLDARATAGVERVHDGRYCRTVEVDGDTGLLAVAHHPKEPRLDVTVRGAAARHAAALGGRVRTLFNLDADLDAVHSALGSDPWLAPSLEALPGLRVPGAWCPFELVARTIVGQQVTVKAATTIMGRVAARVGRSVPGAGDGEPALVFPTARAVAEGNLDAIGMPSQRVAALQAAARAFAEGRIPFSPSGGCTAGTREALLAVPGIGPWTVEYFAMRALRDADAWPATDLVLRRALAACAAGLAPAEIRARVERWRPWRAYAAMHLWNRASQERTPP
jgi:DNA-3-methyladenine glycosylase II